MGSNYVEFIREARRVLKPGGVLRIAEVSSRFQSVDAWVRMMTEVRLASLLTLLR